MPRRHVFPSTRHRDDIQGLRAIAVGLVLLNHAGVSFMKGGYVGVDVFFVLSGFLITGLLLADAERHGRVSLATFYVRRARRILPAATLTLVATAIASYAILNVVRAKQALVDIAWSSVFGANIHFAKVGTDYFAQGQPPSVVRHFWSLAVEEQFYLAWPTILTVVVFGAALLIAREHRRLTDRSVLRLLAFTTLVAVVSLAWSIHQTHTDPTIAYFSTLTRAWELALGAALAIGATWLARIPATARLAMSWVGLAAILAAALLFDGGTPFPGSAALLPTVGTGLLLAAGVPPRSAPLAAGRMIANPPMRYLGDISYTVYLWHWPILALAAAHAGHALSTGTNLVLVALSVALSAVTYRYVENPMRRAAFWRPERSALLLWGASPVLVMMVYMTLASRVDQKVLGQEAQAVMVTSDLAANRAASEQAVQATIAGRPTPAVLRAVQAVQHGAAVPTPLAPAIGTVPNDRYELPANCTSGFGHNTHSQVCPMGNPSAKRSIVVFGDSHAQMWMPAFFDVASRDGWTVYPLVKQGCVLAHYGGYQPVPECTKWFAWAKGQLVRLHPDVAVLSTYIGSAPDPSVRAAMLTAIDDVLTAAKRSAGKTIVMGDVPGLDQAPADCLTKPRATMATCAHTISAPQQSVDAEIQAAVQRFGAALIDTTPWFCADGVCPPVIGHTIPYVDTNHITKTYTQQLLAPFRVAFRRAVARAR